MPASTAELDEFGRLIRDARKKLRLSQDAAAALLGIAQSQVSALEVGHLKDVGSKMLGTLASVLQIPQDELSKASIARAHGASGNQYDTTVIDIASTDTTAGAA